MSGFYSNGENFDRIFLTETQLIDRFIGNRLLVIGTNFNGGLGDNSTTSRSSFVDVSGLGSTWKQVSACVSSTSTAFSAGVKTDGTLWTWGVNTSGQLGSGGTTSRVSPVTVAGGGTDWSEVATGINYMAAIKLDGSLWTWGAGTAGQLGSGGTANRSSPVSVTTSNNWLHVATSQYWGTGGHTLAVKADGSLWTWGQNNVGQLGDGSTQNRSSPGTVAGGGFDWLKIAAGGQTSAAIKNDGTLWTWGRNGMTVASIPIGTGVLGDGSSTDRSSPQTVAGGGTNWKSVSISGASSAYMAGIKADGTLWTWGYNVGGRLGDGTTTGRSSPQTVAGGGTTWDHISCSYQHSVAVKTDGSLWTWGINDRGQLATGSTVARSSPGTVIGGVAEWVAASAGGGTDGSGNNFGNTLAIALFIGG